MASSSHQPFSSFNSNLNNLASLESDMANNSFGDHPNRKLKTQCSYSNLHKFQDAKNNINELFNQLLSFLEDFDSFLYNQILNAEEDLESDSISQNNNINNFKSSVGENLMKERFISLLLTAMPDRKHYNHSNVAQISSDRLEKVKKIKHMIERNHMKCAFFGRTSNGKSTVINAMLGRRILPSGIGHTTNCFLQVQGTSDEIGHIEVYQNSQMGRGDSEEDYQSMEPIKSQPIDSVSQLGHSLSDVKLPTDSLIKVFWPNSKCQLLKEDVVLLDSPGVDVDPDMDSWIERYCMDADVFILVANSESTLMQAEKKFFHMVSQRLSKPNMFVLNNRWDASASELEFADQVRKQHTEVCAKFLSQELKVCSNEEARHRIFFISAKEALLNRSKSAVASSSSMSQIAQLSSLDASSSNNDGNSGSFVNSSMNAHSPAPPTHMANGWEQRDSSFSGFLEHFQKILSQSAIQTKFESHIVQGLAMIDFFAKMMQNLQDEAEQEGSSTKNEYGKSVANLNKLENGIDASTQDIDTKIASAEHQVEQMIGSAMNEEILRLPAILDGFKECAFNPDDLFEFKRSVIAFVQREMEKRINQSCASQLKVKVSQLKTLIFKEFTSLVAEEDRATDRFLTLNQLISEEDREFNPHFQIDFAQIFARFQENLEFQFSLGLTSILSWLQQPSSSSHSQLRRMSLWQSREDTPGNPLPGRISSASGISGGAMPLDNMAQSMLARFFPTVLSRNTIGAVVIVGVLLRAAGVRVFAGATALYGAVYAYERATWTSAARHTAFKRQFAQFARRNLTDVVTLTSQKAAYQTRQELLTNKNRTRRALNEVRVEYASQIDKIRADIRRLEGISVNSQQFIKKSISLRNLFVSFQRDFCQQ